MNKFKVGDRVRVLNKHSGNPVEIGFVSVIEKINLSNSGYPYLLKGIACWLREEWLELVSESKPTFKVGDKLKQVKAGNKPSAIGKIISITGVDGKRYESYDSCLWDEWYLEENFELVEETKKSPESIIQDYGTSLWDKQLMTTLRNAYMGECSGCDVYVSENYKPKKQTTMSKITNFVKNLTLSADEKLLRKYGLHDECGETTPEGMDIIENMIYAKPENQKYLLDIAKGLEAEEKKNK